MFVNPSRGDSHIKVTAGRLSYLLGVTICGVVSLRVSKAWFPYDRNDRNDRSRNDCSHDDRCDHMETTLVIVAIVVIVAIIWKPLL